LLFSFALEYAIRWVQDKQEKPKLNGINLLAYVDDVNIVGENVESVKKNKEAALDASKEGGLEVNPENLGKANITSAEGSTEI
jgi:hypothetical protein